MQFRSYEERDLEAMFALDAACFERPFRFQLEDIQRFASEPGAITVLAEEHGEVAGFFIAEPVGDAVYIVTLDVSPDHRRRGLGRELLARAERSVPDAQRSVLHVFTGNAAAVRFYEAIGYQRTGEAKNFYGRDMDAWIYAKPLTKP